MKHLVRGGEHLYSDVKDKLYGIMSDCLGRPECDFHSSQHLVDDLMIDSLGLIDIISSVETIFKVKVEASDLDKIDTVGDLINFVIKEVYE